MTNAPKLNKYTFSLISDKLFGYLDKKWNLVISTPIGGYKDKMSYAPLIRWQEFINWLKNKLS